MMEGPLHPDIEQVLHLGDLTISLPYVVACDPIVEPEAPFFTQMVPTGSFPVYAYVCDGDYAYVALQFSKAKVKTWKLALCEGQNEAELTGDEIFGYGVDAGLGCFMSLNAQEALLAHMEELEEDEDYVSYYDNVVDPLLYGPEAQNANHCELRPDPSQPDNVLIFRSGMGDGFYPSYFGYDAQGQVVCLVTDFCMLEVEGQGEGAPFDFNPN
jgi:hypothetical protein